MTEAITASREHGGAVTGGDGDELPAVHGDGEEHFGKCGALKEPHCSVFAWVRPSCIGVFVRSCDRRCAEPVAESRK